MDTGILSYGTSVPRHRIESAEIWKVWKNLAEQFFDTLSIGERAVIGGLAALWLASRWRQVDVLSALGAVFGIGLSMAARAFHVETDPRVLATEGAESADAVLALTGWDEVNILVCGIAAQFKVHTRIARIRSASAAAAGPLAGALPPLQVRRL